MRAARRRVVLAVSIVAALALLCCGGSVSAFFLGELDQPDGPVSASFECGGEILPADANLPAFADYNPRQVGHALAIVRAGDDKKVPVRGWVIAIAVALVESNLKNYANDNPRYPRVRQLSMALPHDAVGHDHDSVGLFQQRPVEGDGGWGTVAELMTPRIAATKFYNALVAVPGWEQLPLTVAAQTVQRSAFPDAYAAREAAATEIVNALTGGGARTPSTRGRSAGRAPTRSPADARPAGRSPRRAGRYRYPRVWSPGSGPRAARTTTAWTSARREARTSTPRPRAS